MFAEQNSAYSSLALFQVLFLQLNPNLQHLPGILLL